MTVNPGYLNPTISTGGASPVPEVYAWSTFTDGDASPDVSTGTRWKTGNTNPTTITNFDNPNAAGQKLVVLFLDANTTIQENANIKLEGRIDFTGNAYDILSFEYDASCWVESERDLK